jgi:type II secretory pathway component PulC
MALGYGAEDGFLYPDEFDRDPLEPLINAEGVINVKLVRQYGDLELNGIMYSRAETQSSAIINNTLVKKGDYIGAYKIEEIKLDSVVLNKKGKKISLEISKEE